MSIFTISILIYIANSNAQTVHFLSINCAEKTIFVDLENIPAVNYEIFFEKTNRCILKFKFASDLSFLYISMKINNWQTFSTEKTSKTISDIKIFQGKVLLQLNSTTKSELEPLLLDPLLYDKINYSQLLLIILTQIGNDKTIFELLITNIYDCKKEIYFSDSTFKCQNYTCIDKSLFCDGKLNCPNSNIDEITDICKKANIIAFVLPIALSISTVFILIWLAVKLGPCFLARYFDGESVITQFRLFEQPQTLSYFPSYSLEISSNVSTPNNLPIAPPAYNKEVNIESAKAALPPSYSFFTETTPDFFRRFFGKSKHLEYSTGKSFSELN